MLVSVVIFYMCNTFRFIRQFRLHFEFLGPTDFLPGGLVAKSCPTLCDPMDYSLTGSSVHGIIPGKKTSGLSFSSLGDLLDPGIEPASPALAGRAFYH